MCKRRGAVVQRLVQVVTLVWMATPGVAQQILFQDRASEAGVTALGRGRGVVFGDYNADGYDDLLVCRLDRSVALFQNRGDGTFVETTISAGLTYIGTPMVAVLADFDNNGWPDIYIAGIGRNQLYSNTDGFFTEVTKAAGVGDMRDAVAVAAADVNLDGWLDLYVANFQQGNILYINNGDGTFRDGTDEANAGHRGLAMGIEFCDYDNDGDPDLLLSHDGSEGNVLLENDGQGQFTDVASKARVKYAPQAMGVDFGDYNRDGHFDLYITLLGDNLLYHNLGDGSFDLLQAAQANDGGMGWGLTWLDFDNDGWLDLYVANESGYSSPAFANVLYRNLGNGSFEEVPGGGGTASLAGSYGCATADVDGDGDLDLYVTNSQRPNHLYINQGNENRWFQVRLEGVQSNRSAVGARLRLVAGGGQQVSEVRAGGGFASQNSLTQHFGLAYAHQVDTLEIRWPSGVMERYTNLPANRRVGIVEGVGIVTAVEKSLSPLPTQHRLHANYPNPFFAGLARSARRIGSGDVAPGRSLAGDGRSRIPFTLAGSMPQGVRLAIYDLLGREVRVLVDRSYSPGTYEISWDGRDSLGRLVNSGIYFVRMTAGSFQAQRRLLFLR